MADETNAGGLTDAERGSLGWIAACPTDLAAVECIVAEREAAAREQGRAEADAGWAAEVEVLADEVDEQWEHADHSGGNGENVMECARCWQDGLRALLTADHAKALDAVKAAAYDEAVREMHDLGWTHDAARYDGLARNPYRADRLTTDTP